MSSIVAWPDDWTIAAYRAEAIANIGRKPEAGIVCGGVDTAVAAVLIHAAVGDRLTCVFVDHGLMREGEAKEMVALFRESRR